MARTVTTSAYVEASNQNGTDLTGSIGSMQAWHRPTAIDGEIMCKAVGLVDGTARYAYGLDYAGGGWRFWIGDGSSSLTGASGGTANVGQWKHVLGVRRLSGEQELWVDGKLLASTAAGTFTTTVDAFVIGQCDDGDAPADGPVRDVAIWEAALTGDEIVRLFQGVVRPNEIRPQKLRGYWPLTGGASSEPDLSRYAAHGTLTGPPVPVLDQQYVLPPLAAQFQLNFQPLFVGGISSLAVSSG